MTFIPLLTALCFHQKYFLREVNLLEDPLKPHFTRIPTDFYQQAPQWTWQTKRDILGHTGPSHIKYLSFYLSSSLHSWDSHRGGWFIPLGLSFYTPHSPRLIIQLNVYIQEGKLYYWSLLPETPVMFKNGWCYSLAFCLFSRGQICQHWNAKHLKTSLLSVSISLPVASLRQGRNLFEEVRQECFVQSS